MKNTCISRKYTVKSNMKIAHYAFEKTDGDKPVVDVGEYLKDGTNTIRFLLKLRGCEKMGLKNPVLHSPL